MPTSTHTFEFGTADFNAVYEGGQFLAGSTITGVPWDIGAPQPAVVDLDKRGRIRGAVLDVGCGLGDNAVYLASRGHHVTALDAASTAIAIARQRAAAAGSPDIEFTVANATDLADYADRFDTVLDSALYHTLDASIRPRYLSEIHRAARPGAWLNLLAFADLPGGMPAPLAVSEAIVRSDLERTGWRITELTTGIFKGAASTTRGFFQRVGWHPAVDEQGRTELPIWIIYGDRV